jgi:hypothetical protein
MPPQINQRNIHALDHFRREWRFTFARRIEDALKSVRGGFDLAQPQHACRTFQAVRLAEHFFQQRRVGRRFLKTQQAVVEAREMLRAFRLEQCVQFFIFDHGVSPAPLT